MNHQVFLLLFSLALFRALCWPYHGPAQLRAAAKLRTRLQRLLKPRTPDDCPACCHASTPSSGGWPAPAPVRPWREIHALVGDGKHGQAEPIQTFRCQACCTTFSARRDTALYRLKTPSHHVAVVLSALAEGLDPSAAERVFGYRQATITTWLTRAGEHAQSLHKRSFSNLHLPHLQLDELRTRLRSATQIRLAVAGH